jgi:ankyrin repeat protein
LFVLIDFFLLPICLLFLLTLLIPLQLKRGATALHAATYRGHNRVVTALLEARAQPELLDAYGRRAMEYALDRCSMLVIEMLLDYSK